jgi:hypothetical protein
MRLFNHLKYLLILSCVIAISCTNTPSIDKETNKDKKTETKVVTRPDSLFMFKNITSSMFQADSSTMSQYVHMDTIQKMQYLTPKIIDSENPDVMKVGQTYINDYMYSYFISKQDKIGDYQPIIVSAHGDDYGALILLLLDKNNKPVSHILLCGGLSAGPDGELGDSIVLLHDRESLIKHDTIITYILRVRQPENKDNALPTIDSISYIRKILATGEIKTIKTDSVRYSRKIDWPKYSW